MGGSKGQRVEVRLAARDASRGGHHSTSSEGLGSGSAPGTDHILDGAWFSWVTMADATYTEFDLACLWSARIEPTAGNDANWIRAVPSTADALTYVCGSEPVDYCEWTVQGRPAITERVNTPGLPDSPPFWRFVDDGATTDARAGKEH